MRALVAAFGNELRGDDGFGLAVLRRLEGLPVEGGAGTVVRLLEVGTGGVRLAQELLSPCDRLVIVDAVRRGAAPGTVFVLRVEQVAPPREVDLHLVVPSQALGLASALGALPRETFVVGCEPSETEELRIGLSEAVEAAVDRAAREVRRLLELPA